MYTVPDAFAARLQAAFNGRLRVRWSSAKHEFQVEQRVARPLASFPTSGQDDDSIRLRDGYLYLMSIQPGTRMPCPRCGLELKVPVRDIRQVSCQFCKARGNEHRVAAGYFPLDETLIDYLARLDPERDATKRLRNEVDAANERLMQAQRQRVLDASLDVMNDDFSRIAGIPSVGYTGKEFRG